MLKPGCNGTGPRWIVLSVASMLFSVAAAVRFLPLSDEADCSSRARVVSGLEQLFGEAQRARAVSGDDSVIEFFSSHETETWTLLQSLPDGRTCIVATGREGWHMPEEELREVSLEI